MLLKSLKKVVTTIVGPPDEETAKQMGMKIIN
jgi:hypothetical protein